MFKIGNREIGQEFKPFVIAEVGINHNGDLVTAKKMVDAAFASGCECVKFQCHIVEDEMSPLAKETIPGNAKISIWDIMKQSELTELEEIELKAYVESMGMIFLSTPFSRAAADRLEGMGVSAYKIGSGECNNYPLVEHIAGFGKPIILSTGMNNIESVKPAVEIIKSHGCPYALLHCTSIYPTPYDKIRLNAIKDLAEAFPDAILGLSDHSLSPFPSIASVALGASIVERHFTYDKTLPGPDIEISMDPDELKLIIEASEIVWKSTKGSKSILNEEQVTIDFAYSTAVAIADIKTGEVLTKDNLWVKRPGIGEIKAKDYNNILGKTVSKDIKKDQHLKWDDIHE